MTDLLTTRQVQTLLRVDRTTIYRMVEGGQLPAIRVGKQWRFARAEIERWLQAARARQVQFQADVSGTLAANTAPAADDDLRAMLPVTCAQLIQDVFAEMLGVMIIVTDMQGRPITQVSNPCGFFAKLTDGCPGTSS
ncbi:MAG: helix-turn-helix domain-containing protein [Anaerolineae bacterium]